MRFIVIEEEKKVAQAIEDGLSAGSIEFFTAADTVSSYDAFEVEVQ